MASAADLIQQIRDEGEELDFFGPQSETVIRDVESALSCHFPDSYRRWLKEYGGGGVVDEYISGIDGEPLTPNEGTVYGDTVRCREEHGLPANLAVIFYQDGEVIWCLVTDQMRDGECPIVSFDVTSGKTEPLAKTFDDFWLEYLGLRAQ